MNTSDDQNPKDSAEATEVAGVSCAEPAGSPVECPHCHQSFGVNLSAHVPKEQVIYLGKGEFFAADTIGKQICNTEKLLRSVAENIGQRVIVFLKSVDVEPQKIKLGFLVIESPTDKRQKANQGNAERSGPAEQDSAT